MRSMHVCVCNTCAGGSLPGLLRTMQSNIVTVGDGIGKQAERARKHKLNGENSIGRIAWEEIAAKLNMCRMNRVVRKGRGCGG